MESAALRVAAELRLAADRHLLYSAKPGALDDLLRRAAATIDQWCRHESDQSRYASECDLCETDGPLHMFECPNNPREVPL